MTEEIQAKKGMSTGAKWGLGCGIGCLTIVILVAVGGFIGYRFVKGKVAQTVTELKSHGFSEVKSGQNFVVTEDITVPTIYLAQMVKITGNCTTNLGIVAQMAEIHGRVDGKVYFRGQILVVQPNAELRGGLDVQAQVIQKFGRIDGGITGVYTSLDDKSKK